MKKCLMALWMAVIASKAIALNYTVTGSVDGTMDGQMVYMTDYFEENAVIDSTKVVDRKFRFEGSYGRDAYVRIECGMLYGNCVLDDSPVDMDFNTHAPSDGGGVSAKVVREFMSRSIAMYNTLDSIAALRGQYPDDDAFKAATKEAREGVFNDNMKYTEGIIAGWQGGVGEMALMAYGAWCKPEQWETVYAALPPRLRDLRLTQKINGKFQNRIQTSVGKMFVDILGKTVDGTESRLSDYVGKGRYVLVDFYASWCGPCRQEAQETLKPLYEEYKDSPLFTLLGVAVWDSEEGSKRVIADEGYGWPQIIGTGMAPMEEYGFDGIPMIMLFAPDGTIIARDIRGKDIVDAVRGAIGAPASLAPGVVE